MQANLCFINKYKGGVMVRRYFSFIIVTLLSLSSIYAQDVKKTGGFARILGMGNNPYIIDPYTMTVNPAWGSLYDDFLFGDLGSSNGNFAQGSGQFAGANFSLGSTFTLGALLSRNDFNGFSIAQLDPLNRASLLPNVPPLGVVSRLNALIPAGVQVVPLDNNIEVFGTLKFGKTSFGLGVAYASTTQEVNSPAPTGSTEATASQFGVNAGLLASLSSSFMLDVGASLIMPSANFKPSTGNESSVSETIIALNGRIFWRFSNKLSFVPIVGFVTASGEQTVGLGTTDTTSDIPSVTVLGVGIGANYIVGDFLLAGGISFNNASITTPSTPNAPELSTTIFVFPLWNFGIEWNMTDWLVARLGYTATTAKSTIESSTPTPTDRNAITEFVSTVTTGGRFAGPNGATVGLGFRFGNFSLDATVNEDVLRQGLAAIGGTGATFAYLSGSYAIP